MQIDAALFGDGQRANRGAYARRGQRAGVAVGQHPVAGGQQVGAPFGHALAQGTILFEQRLGTLGQGVRALGKAGFHGVQAVHQVHRRGARRP